MAAEILVATVNGVLRRPRRAARSLEEVIARLRVTPSVSVTPEGHVSFAFEPALARRAWQQILDDALDVLADAGRRGPVALALDEFQQVAEVGAGIGGAFKAAADRLTNVSLLFAGSHQSVMEKLTRARGAPLYGMGEVLTLEIVPSEEMTSYLRRRARAGGKRLTKATAELLFERAGGVPNDVQWLAHAAYEHTAGEEVDERAIDAGLAAVVARQSSSFAERFEALAPSQQPGSQERICEPPSPLAALDELGARQGRERLADGVGVGDLHPLQEVPAIDVSRGAPGERLQRALLGGRQRLEALGEAR